MMAVATLLFAAAVGFALSSRLRIPAVPLLIGAGVLVRVLGVEIDAVILQDILILGLTFLVFVTGTELSLRRVGEHLGAAVRVAFGQFALLFLCGVGVARALDFSWVEGAYLGVALGASSTLVVVRTLARRSESYAPFGRLVLGVLLVQDVIVILVVAALSQAGEGLMQAESSLLRTVGLGFAAWLCARHLMPLLIVRMGLDEEGILLVLLALLSIFVGGAYVLGVPLVAGAFFAGFAVSTFPVDGVIRGQLTSLSDFFLALFFTALGATLTLPSMRGVFIAIALVAVVLVATPLVVVAVGERAGLSARASIEGGLLLAQTSELSLVVMLVGAAQGHVDEMLVGVVTLVTVVTMAMTPFVARYRVVWWLMRHHPSRRKLRAIAHRGEADGKVVVLGAGAHTAPLLDELAARGIPAMVIDEDPLVVERIADAEACASAVRADAGDFAVLDSLGAANARVIISTLHRVQDNCALVKRYPGVPVLVRTFERSEALSIEAAGGVPIRYYEETVERFMEWYDGFEASSPT